MKILHKDELNNIYTSNNPEIGYYTGLYIVSNGKINYIRYADGNFYLVNTLINGPHIPLRLEMIIPLLHAYQSYLMVDDFLATNTGIKITDKDFKQFKINFFNLTNNISTYHDNKHEYDLLKSIYDYFKMHTDYWFPANYSRYTETGRYVCYGKMNNLIKDTVRFVDHPYDYIGVFNDSYATCDGMADALSGIINYYGIDAKFIKNKFHAAVQVNLDNGNATILDLAAERCTNEEGLVYWKDSRHVGYGDLDEIVKPTDTYRFFLTSNPTCFNEDELEKDLDTLSYANGLPVKEYEDSLPKKEYQRIRKI
ncbi:MAG TPA: hypothetical protein PLC25_03055 [Bacilli bacterium]|nr:hypothetical protein [Bacilli bacterium]